MKVDPKRFDQTTLDQREQEFVIAVVAVLANQLTNLVMTEGVVYALQAAGGAVARMIKANLEAGITPATIADVQQLRLFDQDNHGQG